MIVANHVSIKTAATLLHRGRETVLTWVAKLDVPIVKIGKYGNYIANTEFARLKQYSHDQPDLTPKVGSRLTGHVSFTELEFLLHRRRYTLLNWCEKIGIPIIKIGFYGRYIARADLARLEEYAADQPAWKSSRKTKAESTLLPIAELDHRIKAASRWKRPHPDQELYPEHINVQLIAMAIEQRIAVQ